MTKTRRRVPSSITVVPSSPSSSATADELRAFVESTLPDYARAHGAIDGKPLTIHVGTAERRVTAVDGANGVFSYEMPAAIARRDMAWGTVLHFGNGVALVPTLQSFLKRGVLPLLSTEPISLSALIERLHQKGQRPQEGSLACALHHLSLHGWLWSPQPNAFALTPVGQAAFQMLPSLTQPLDQVQAMSAELQRLHGLFRDAAAPSQIVERYQALVQQLVNRWGIDDGGSAVERHARTHLRSLLDGAVLGPTMVALGMPLFTVESSGRIVKTDDSIIERVRAQPGASLNGFNPRLMTAAIELMRVQKWAVSEGASMRLTAYGEVIADEAPRFGIPVSYLPSYERMDDILFGSGEPRSLERDQHVDRLINVWASGGDGEINELRAEAHETVLMRLFDELPLEQQPRGVCDVGCGHGRPLSRVVDFILKRTRRGQNLKAFPLVAIGADLYETPRRLTSEVLRAFDGTEGLRCAVVRADVGDPQALDATIRELKLTGHDGRLIALDDLLSLQMFLAHDRELRVRSRDEARSIIAERLSKTDRGVLEQAIARTSGAPVTLPSSSDALLDLVTSQFSIGFCEKGALVPGVAVAGDLVAFLARWSPYCRHGLVMFELHTPRADDFEAAPLSDRAGSHAEKSSVPFVWSTHFVSAQYPLPYEEHLLACELAGLIRAFALDFDQSFSYGLWTTAQPR